MWLMNRIRSDDSQGGNGLTVLTYVEFLSWLKQRSEMGSDKRNKSAGRFVAFEEASRRGCPEKPRSHDIEEYDAAKKPLKTSLWFQYVLVLALQESSRHQTLSILKFYMHLSVQGAKRAGLEKPRIPFRKPSAFQWMACFARPGAELFHVFACFSGSLPQAILSYV